MTMMKLHRAIDLYCHMSVTTCNSCRNLLLIQWNETIYSSAIVWNKKLRYRRGRSYTLCQLL